MNITRSTLLAVLLATSLGVHAQEDPGAPAGAFEDAAATVRRQLDEAIAEFNALQEQIADDMLPLSRTLRDLEGELSAVRLEYQETSRRLDRRLAKEHAGGQLVDLGLVGNQPGSRPAKTAGHQQQRDHGQTEPPGECHEHLCIPRILRRRETGGERANAPGDAPYYEPRRGRFHLSSRESST